MLRKSGQKGREDKLKSLTACHLGAVDPRDGVGTSIWVFGHAHASTITLVDVVDEEGGENGVRTRQRAEGGRKSESRMDMHLGSFTRKPEIVVKE